MTEHLDEEAVLSLAALAPDDPEQLAARTHAATCPRCATLLQQADAMLRLLDQADVPEPIAPELALRIKHKVLAPRSSPWARVWIALCALASLTLALVDGHGAGALELAVGVRCTFYELAFATPPLLMAVASARGMLSGFGTGQLAALTMTGGLLGQVLLRTRCEAAHATVHLMLFHVAVVLGVGVLAAATPKIVGRAR